jgi:hypothetical protein
MATGLTRDDDGNRDDKRVAGWIAFGVAVSMGILGIFPRFTAATDIVTSFLGFSAVCFGITIFEKFGTRRSDER